MPNSWLGYWDWGNADMKVLATCPGYISSVKLCGDVQLNHLKENDSLEYQFKVCTEITIHDLAWLDVFYVIRGDSEYCLSLVKWCKKHKKIVIYVLDDNLLEVPAYLSSSEFYLKKSTQKYIRQLIHEADGFVSPSCKLIEKYSLSAHKVLQIIEPSLDPIKEKSRNEVLKIGFAGSIDHGNDIDEMLSDVLRTIKDKYGDGITIEFFGPKTKLGKELGIVEHPYVNSYGEYQKKMKEYNWDIGLAPLPESYFNSFKHYNKLVEYESYGIAGIYSDVFPFRYALKDGVNGLSVKNDTESWVEALSRIIEDSQLRNEICKNCIVEANTIYSLEKSSEELYDYLNGFAICTDETGQKTSLKLSLFWWKLKHGTKRFVSLMIKAPRVIFRKIFRK